MPTTTALPSGTPASSTTTPARPAPPPEPPGTTTAVTPAPAPESDELIQAPSNITGICDPSIQPLIDAALRGTRPVGEVIDDVEPVLWDMAAVLPILQDTTIVAAGPSVQNVSLSGAVPVGIVGDAGEWVKLRQ